MNISVKGEYALQAIFDLASSAAAEPVKIAEIARRQDRLRAIHKKFHPRG